MPNETKPKQKDSTTKPTETKQIMQIKTAAHSPFNIESLTLEGYDYQAQISYNDPNNIEIFHLVYGEYQVDWDDDIPEPYILTVFDKQTDIEIDCEPMQTSLDVELQDYDGEHTQRWYEDKQSAAIDHAYDSYREDQEFQANRKGED